MANPTETISMADVEAFLKQHKAPEAKPEMEPPKSKVQLEGGVSYTPRMKASDERISRDVFPQAEDTRVQQIGKKVLFPVQAAVNGLEEVPESIGNFVAGVGQQALGVPQSNRVTMGDLGRKLDPSFIAPSEIARMPQFQRQLSQHPVMQKIWGPGNFAGGFLFPLGATENALAKIPLAVRSVGQGLPLVAKIGQLGRETQIARDVAQTLGALRRGAGLSALEKARTNPLVGGAAAGATYAPVFAGGQQFGQNRTLPTNEQQANNALGGAAFGGLLGAAAGLLQRILLKQQIAKLAQASPLDKIPEIAQGRLAQNKEVLPPAKVVGQDLNARLMQNLARRDNTDEQKQIAIRHMLDAYGRKYSGESDEHMLEIAKARAAYQKANLRGVEKRELLERQQQTRQESRHFQEQRQQSNFQQRQNERQQNISTTGEQTEHSGSRYQDLADRIEGSASYEELDAMRREIFDPGAGPKGQRLLDNAQQNELKRLWRHRRQQIAEENGEPPGESPVTGASEPESGRMPQKSPSSGPAGGPSSPASGAPPAGTAATSKMASGAGPQGGTAGGASTEEKTATTPKSAETTPLKSPFDDEDQLKQYEAARYPNVNDEFVEEADKGEGRFGAVGRWAARSESTEALKDRRKMFEEGLKKPKLHGNIKRYYNLRLAAIAQELERREQRVKYGHTRDWRETELETMSERDLKQLAMDPDLWRTDPDLAQAASDEWERRWEARQQRGKLTQPVPGDNPVKSFLFDAFRKTFDPKLFGTRTNRYRLAVSVGKLAEAAGLDQAKTTAMKRWVADMARIRRELTYADLRLKRLVEWAHKNEDEWIGSQSKVKLSRKSDEEGNYYQILDHTEREGRYRRIALRAKMEQDWEDATQRNLEFEEVRNPDGTLELRVEAKPHLEVTTNGMVENGWQENKDGTLEIKGNIKPLDLGEFKPPKSADELFNQAEDLMGWRSHFKEELSAAKKASIIKAGGSGKILRSYDHLGDGTTPTQVMEEVFQKLGMPWLNGHAPNTHVWHVDDADHVTTVNFHQARTRANMEAVRQEVDEKLARVDQLLKKVTDPVSGKIDYDALWANKQLMSRVHAYFPGLSEIGFISALWGRQIHKAGRDLARASGADTIFAGTIDDILRDNTRFGGDVLSDALHQMFGEINSNFLNDTTGEWHPVRSAEELAELLNDYKGADITRSSYRRRAVELLEEDARKDNFPITEQVIADANRHADTAFMIRQHYKNLANSVQQDIKRMEIRQKDAKTGVPSAEGRKLYTDADLDAQGRVKVSAYNPLYHAALKELHAGLTLQSTQTANGLHGFIGDTPARVSSSIMSNNPATALKNFFDQAPMTLAYFHKHFLQAVVDLHMRPEYKEAIERMPVIPQAEMSLVKLEERLKDTREAENWAEAAFKGLDKINHWLQKKLDPIFEGHSPLVSAADRAYAKYSALASFYKSAELRGVDRHEFVSDLINGRLDPRTRDAVMKEMSLGLTQTLNSVGSHINKDLYASSAFGKLTAQYSTPGRRAMKLWVNWFKESYQNPASAMKLLGSLAGMVALGGSGAVPQSLQAVYRVAGAMSGENEKVEKNLQALDELNLLRKVGIDWSPNFGPDWLTNAMPTLEAIEKMVPGAIQMVTSARNPGELAFNTVRSGALEGLHMFPKIGTFGYESWKRLLTGIEAAGVGVKKVYFEYNGQLQSVPVTGYTFMDALRHFAIGGIEPKAIQLEAQKKIDLAKKQDAKFRANKSIIPERSSGAIYNPGLLNGKGDRNG